MDWEDTNPSRPHACVMNLNYAEAYKQGILQQNVYTKICVIAVLQADLDLCKLQRKRNLFSGDRELYLHYSPYLQCCVHRFCNVLCCNCDARRYLNENEKTLYKNKEGESGRIMNALMLFSK